MLRRQVLVGASLTLTSLTGCIGETGDGRDRTPEETPAKTQTETPTPTQTKTHPDVYTMPEGSPLVEVFVVPNFTGNVVLQSDCRDENLSINSREEKGIYRQEEGETCFVHLDIDGQTDFERQVNNHESYSLTVTREGDIEVEVVEV